MSSKSLDLQVILSAREKVTGPLKKINATSTATARALKQSRDEVKRLQASQRDISSFRKMGTALKENGQALSQAQDRPRKLGEELHRTKNPTNKLRNEYNQAREEVQKFTRKSQDQRKEMGRLVNRLKQAGINTRDLGREEQRLENQMRATNERIQRQKRYLDQLGKADIGGRFNSMTSEVGRFSRQVATSVGIVGGSLGLLSHSYASNATEVDEWAKRLGIGTQKLSEWYYVGKQFGAESDAMTDALKELSLRTDEFAFTGAGPAAEAFERLGLGQRELASATNDTDALMQLVLGRLRTIENVAARQRLADELFGGSGGEQLAEMASLSARELAAMRQEAVDLGAALSSTAATDARAYIREWRRIQGGLEGVRNTLGAELMPVFTESMTDMLAWLKDNRSEVKAFAEDFGTNLKAALPIIRDVAVGAASTAKGIGMITSKVADMVGGFDNLGMILAFLFALKPVLAMLAFGKAVFSVGSALVGLAGGLPAVAAGIKAITVALLSNPIGLIIAGIALAGYLIYKNWAPISAFFADLWGEIKQAFSGGLLGIGKLILNWSPIGMFYKAFRSVLGWFGVELPDTFTGFGSMLIDGLISGVTGGLGKLRNTITGAGSAAIGWFKETLGIRSPSRVFMGAGRDTLEGYRKGLEQQEPQALRQVTGFGKRVRQVGAGIAIGATALPVSAGSIQFDNRPPIAAAGAASAGGGGDTITVNVYAAPGQSSQEIAAQVERILQERDRRKATRSRSALYDQE